jgi:Sulfotransferase domain
MELLQHARPSILEGESGICITRDRTPLPSFFIVGPPRTGTSWLYEVLKERVSLPLLSKETRFFDKHFDRGIRWYTAHYAAGKMPEPSGEIAPTYFASASARERIAQIIPNAKIVCIFRNPVERVISLYRLKRAYGMIPWRLEEAISKDPELVESSKYATHLKSWQFKFGSDRVLATVYEDLRENPQRFMDKLMAFIGMQRFPLLSSEVLPVHDSVLLTEPRSYLRTHSAMILADQLKARRLDRVVSIFRKSPFVKLLLSGGPAFHQLSRDFVVNLYEQFRPEVEKLEAILNRDLSAWKSEVLQAKSQHGNL